MSASLNSKNRQQCEQDQADFMHFSSPRAARFAPQWPRRGKRTSKPLDLSYSQVSDARCPQGWQKRRRTQGCPCGRIQAVRTANSRYHVSGKTRSSAKTARQACELAGGSRTRQKAEKAPLCARAALRDAGQTAALFERDNPATTGTRPDDYSSAESATATVSAGRSRTNPNRAILALSPRRFLAVRTILV